MEFPTIAERNSAIVERLQTKGAASFSDIGREFGVSRSTVAGLSKRFPNGHYTSRDQYNGENAPHARFTSEEIRAFRARHQAGERCCALARAVGATPSAMSVILRGLSYRDA